MLKAEPKDLWCFGQNPKTCWKLAAADSAEGGRDTRVLGDPMDLIRRQSYMAKHGEHTVQQDTN